MKTHSLHEEENFWPSISDMFLSFFVIALALAAFYQNTFTKDGMSLNYSYETHTNTILNMTGLAKTRGEYNATKSKDTENLSHRPKMARLLCEAAGKVLEEDKLRAANHEATWWRNGAATALPEGAAGDYMIAVNYLYEGLIGTTEEDKTNPPSTMKKIHKVATTVETLRNKEAESAVIRDLRRERDALAAERDRLKQQLAAQQKMVAEQEKKVAELEKDLEQHRKALAERNKILSDTLATLKARKQELDDCKKKLTAREKELTNTQATLKTREQELKRIKATLAAKEKQLAEAQTALTAQKKELAKATANAKAREQQHQQAMAAKEAEHQKALARFADRRPDLMNTLKGRMAAYHAEGAPLPMATGERDNGIYVDAANGIIRIPSSIVGYVTGKATPRGETDKRVLRQLAAFLAEVAAANNTPGHAWNQDAGKGTLHGMIDNIVIECHCDPQSLSGKKIEGITLDGNEILSANRSLIVWKIMNEGNKLGRYPGLFSHAGFGARVPLTRKSFSWGDGTTAWAETEEQYHGRCRRIDIRFNCTPSAPGR